MLRRFAARRFWKPLLCAGTLLLSAGCQGGGWSPVRMPSWSFRDPQVERRSYEFHDPFPDRTSAPDTMTRPRGFILQRTESRRAADQRMMQGASAEMYAPGPEVVPPGGMYPQSLRE